MRHVDFSPLYRSTIGFVDDELKIEVKEQTLNVKGEKKPDAAERHFLHRGIAARSFERRFQLADHVEVSGAALKDGLLDVDLVRNVPERLKPRSIPIGTGGPNTPQIEAKPVA
jgi:molecular chaperone IbpA